VCSRVVPQVEFRNAVSKLVGVELPVTAAFDYPSITAVSGFLEAQLVQEIAVSEGETTPHQHRRRSVKPQRSSRSHEDYSLQVQSKVMEAVCVVLGSTVGEDVPLMEAGLDSLGAVMPQGLIGFEKTCCFDNGPAL
jgi:hypothetical protein